MTANPPPVLQQVEEFSAGNLIEICKIIFSKYGLPSKIVSDVDMHFIL